MLDLSFKVVGSVPVASITPSIPTKGTPAKWPVCEMLIRLLLTAHLHDGQL